MIGGSGRKGEISMITAKIYVDGKLVYEVIKLQHETEMELWRRVKDSLSVTVNAATSK